MIYGGYVWSYWLAWVFLFAAILVCVAAVIGYYRVVILALYRWKLWRQHHTGADLKPVSAYQREQARRRAA
jgi:hypothetical protein